MDQFAWRKISIKVNILIDKWEFYWISNDNVKKENEVETYQTVTIFQSMICPYPGFSCLIQFVEN